MGYEMESKRIDLGNGDSAELFLELRHGTQRSVNALTRGFLKYPDDETPKLVIKSAEDMALEGPKTVDVDLAAVDWDVVNDVIIVGQVKAWSFGEVTQETLDSISERNRERLVQEVNLLYGKQRPLPLSGDGNLAKAYSLPSKCRVVTVCRLIWKKLCWLRN